MDGVKAGLQHESGVALKTANKNLPPSKDRNSVGTPNHLLRCIYYHDTNPLACNILRHCDCRNKACQMKSKSKEERKTVWHAIEKEMVHKEVERLVIKSKIFLCYFLLRMKYYFYSFWHLTLLISKSEQNSINDRTFALRSGLLHERVLRKKLTKSKNGLKNNNQELLVLG